MVLGLPFAHIPSRFAEDGHRGHDVDAIDASQVRTAHADQPGTHVEPRLIAILLLAPSLPLLFRQTCPCAPVCWTPSNRSFSAQTKGLLQKE
jgi:hypothetical protein